MFFQNPIFQLSSVRDFEDDEIRDLRASGCLTPWDAVLTPVAPVLPRLILVLAAEEFKPRLISYAHPLHECCTHVPISMNRAALVAHIAWQGCYRGNLDDKSGFHHVLLQPESWPSIGVYRRRKDYVWTVLNCGWNKSPFVYLS